MKYQAVIFDFDYTLGDATDGIVSSVNYALEKMGYERADRERIRRTVGLSLQDTYAELTHINFPQGEEIISKGREFETYFKEQADRVMVEHTKLFGDAIDVLSGLKEQGVTLAVVTTKYHYRMDAILKNCGADHYFARIVGSEDVAKKKPDPEGVQMVLNELGLSKEQVLYVGDSAVDAKTARAAGVDFAGVTTGTTGEGELREYPCIGVFKSLTELSEFDKESDISVSPLE